MSKQFTDVIERDAQDTVLSEDSEFTEWREFSFTSQIGIYDVKKLLVIWNQDILKKMSPVVMYGQLFVGDVLILTWANDWPMRPRRGQIFWSPKDTPWKVMVCQEIRGILYRISIQQTETTL